MQTVPLYTFILINVGRITTSLSDTPRDPSVWASPSGEIMEGSSVTLTCNSDANPAAEYSWYKYANSYQTFLGNGAQLVLRYIQSSGSAEYRCTAQNKLGRSHNSISINVKCE